MTVLLILPVLIPILFITYRFPPNLRLLLLLLNLYLRIFISLKYATINGNLTAEKNLINVSEVISLDSSEPVAPPPVPQTPPAAPASQSSLALPNLYPALQWEKNEKKVLLFTSGKRRIEQEGIYLESVLVKDYPQEFINYYINELSGSGFKQTLNSTDTNGTTITYAKDNAFFTFGIKYSYSGSGEKRSLSGYKAFLEHN